jgi:hypothetical protein
MKVFLSWSGERSHYVAKALRDWLPLVLHFADPWLSDRDIAAGERWSEKIATELEARQFGILVLTRENVAAPWVLFEAGALSKAFATSQVVPYLVDLEFKDLSGPLAQFQAAKAERSSTRELIEAINARADRPLQPAHMHELFDALWPKLEATLSSLPSVETSATSSTKERDVIEELVEVTRRVERRLDDLTDNVGTIIGARGTGAIPHVDTLTVSVTGEFPQLKGISEFEIRPRKDVGAHSAGIVGLNAGEFGSTWFVREGRGGRSLSRVELQNFAAIGSATQLVELTETEYDDDEDDNER